VLLLSWSASAVTLISKSDGLEDPTKESGHTELEFGDINGDGHLDIVSVGDHGSPWINSDEHGIMVWLGDGSGSWSVIQSGDFGYGGCAVGDLNLDGYMDVAWGVHHNYGSGGFGDRLMGAALGDGSGASWTPWDDGLATGGEEYGMFATDLADFDVDGDLDIVCESFGSGNGVRVYENHLDGTWSPAWLIDGGNAVFTIETGDFNADGLPDFICTRIGTHVYFGDGNMGFTLNQTGIPGYMVSVDCGDFNGDGRDDIVCSLGSDSGVHCYYYDDGSAQWVDASLGLPAGGTYVDLVQFGYINSDDHLDLVLYDDPFGQVYLGDGAGFWTSDATWTMPGSGNASALRIDGDIDHDGREDIAIQGETTVGGWPQNQLRVYSPWIEPPVLNARVLSPDGGETLMGLSIREIRWLTAVPPSQGSATVDLYLSVSGAGGPWNLIEADAPDNGSYQWIVPPENSSTCRIRLVAETTTETVEDYSDDDFTISGMPGIGYDHSSPLNSTTGLRVIPNPAGSIPLLDISPAPEGPVTVTVFDVSGRMLSLIETWSSEGSPIPLTNGSGERLSIGVYIIRVQIGSERITTRFAQL